MLVLRKAAMTANVFYRHIFQVAGKTCSLPKPTIPASHACSYRNEIYSYGNRNVFSFAFQFQPEELKSSLCSDYVRKKLSCGFCSDVRNTAANVLDDANNALSSQRTDEEDLMEKDSCVLYMRGLPYSVKEGDITEFFRSVNIKPCKITLNQNSYGQSNGKGKVEFANENEAQIALKKHNGFLGNRYIELSRDAFPQMNAERFFLKQRSFGNFSHTSAPRQQFGRNPSGFWVRLTGVPYRATPEDVSQFFSPLNIVPTSIDLQYTYDGIPNGICKVKFKTQEEAMEALRNNNKFMGERYIKIQMMTPFQDEPRSPYEE